MMRGEGGLSGDRYRNFDNLRRHEDEGADFAIRIVKRRGMPAVVIAPHGGKIELGTSEIAAAIAADTYNLYCFEGRKKSENRRALHITSTNFDEPRCLELIALCDVVVAVHGLQGGHKGIDVGGLDQELRCQISANLRSMLIRLTPKSTIASGAG